VEEFEKSCTYLKDPQIAVRRSNRKRRGFVHEEMNSAQKKRVNQRRKKLAEKKFRTLVNIEGIGKLLEVRYLRDICLKDIS